MEKNFLVSTPVVVFQLVTEEKKPKFKLKKKKGRKGVENNPVYSYMVGIKIKTKKKTQLLD